MEENREDDQTAIYISLSRQNIDKCLYNYEYRKAFGLLILVLERLDENQKREFIKYYSENLIKLGVFSNQIIGSRL